MVVAGVLLMAGCASALAYVPDAFWLFAAYAGMAFGWAAISGTAITQIIGRWFDAKRGLALNLALTGASAAGFVIVPALVAAIERFGLGPGVMLDRGHGGAGAAGADRAEPGGAEPRRRQPVAGAGCARRRRAAPGPAAAAAVCAVRHRLAGAGGLPGAAAAAAGAQDRRGRGHAGRGGDDRQLAARPAGAGQLHGPHRPPPRHRRQLRLAGARLGADAGGQRYAGAGHRRLLPGRCVGGQRHHAAGDVRAARVRAAHYGAVITRIWSIGQVMYAFGPIGAGLLLGATGCVHACRCWPAWPASCSPRRCVSRGRAPERVDLAGAASARCAAGFARHQRRCHHRQLRRGCSAALSIAL